MPCLHKLIGLIMVEVLIFLVFAAAIFGVVVWLRREEDEELPGRREFWLEDFRSDDGEEP